MIHSHPVQSIDQYGWLLCRLDQGMFSDEVAVTYPLNGESQKSVFVAKDYVKEVRSHEGKVKVKLIKRNSDWLAILPSARQDFVYVSQKDVTEE